MNGILVAPRPDLQSERLGYILVHSDALKEFEQQKMCHLIMIAMMALLSLAASLPLGPLGPRQLRALSNNRRGRPRRWKKIMGIKRPGSNQEHRDNYDPFRLPLALETDPFRFTAHPSAAPSHSPSKPPTRQPTHEPTSEPTTSAPTPDPTRAPTLEPTPYPTTSAPTPDPTLAPTSAPTSSPTTYRWIPKAWRERDTNGLPNFSYAGYHLGDRDPPTIGRRNAKLEWERNVVWDYGATPDDNRNDTDAFLSALADGGRIFVPRGRYIINQQLIIDKSGTVLGGPDGGNPPELYFPRPLSKTNPVQATKTAGGKATSPYSWGGGLIEFQGGSKTVAVARIIVQNEDPPGILTLETIPSELEVGSTVSISLRGDESLVRGGLCRRCWRFFQPQTTCVDNDGTADP